MADPTIQRLLQEFASTHNNIRTLETFLEEWYWKSANVTEMERRGAVRLELFRLRLQFDVLQSTVERSKKD